MSILHCWKKLLFPNLKFEFLATAASVIGIAGGLNSMFGGNSSSGGQQATNQANPLAPYQQGWAQQLNQLMQNPSSITSTPGYTFGMGQGLQALQRTMAGAGQTQSGQEQIDLQQYGQGYAGQQLQQQISTLGNLSTGNAVQGQQAGVQQQQYGLQNIGQGLGALANIYNTTPSMTNPQASSYYNYGGSSGYSYSDPSGMGYAGTSGF